MPNILEEVEIQLHLWPWSVEIPEESINLTGGYVEFPFCGSPVLSISHEAKLYIPSRMEQFKQLGTPYDNARYQVYETPHGILAGQAALKKLRIRVVDKTFDLEFNARGAAERFSPDSSNLRKKLPLPDTLMPGLRSLMTCLIKLLILRVNIPQKYHGRLFLII